ncbi:hypothetical protein JCM4814A_09730 [Streptomyces phaeofaciens JCM 4814]|uniref:Uncharacterized protein n=1 Tax=Streptomyces phaeofaciens TaxID=68254 RepID=A0A918HIV1_9ACTN|nr:hypothetical protein GCM10010226_52670 [Streptomyces phaeofaciens]
MRVSDFIMATGDRAITAGDLVDAAEPASRANLLGTTSPSAHIYAGLDAWRRQMVQHGTS